MPSPSLYPSPPGCPQSFPLLSVDTHLPGQPASNPPVPRQDAGPLPRMWRSCGGGMSHGGFHSFWCQVRRLGKGFSSEPPGHLRTYCRYKSVQHIPRLGQRQTCRCHQPPVIGLRPQSPPSSSAVSHVVRNFIQFPHLWHVSDCPKGFKQSTYPSAAHAQYVFGFCLWLHRQCKPSIRGRSPT